MTPLLSRFFIPCRLSFLIVIFFVLQFNSSVMSQELVKNYEKFLPREFIKNPAAREQFSALIEAKSKLHPELIYYYLTYYNMFFSASTDSAKAEYSKLKRYIFQLESGYTNKRSKWAKEQILLLEKINIKPDIKSHIIEKFRELVVESLGDFPTETFQIDENQKDFYTAMYFYGKIFSEYMTDTQFKPVLKNAIADEKEELILQYRNAVNENKNDEKILSRFLDHWYLFDPSISPDDKYSHPSVAAIAAELSNEQYSTRHMPHFSAGLTIVPVNMSTKVKPEIYILGYKKSMTFEVKAPFMQIGLNLGYKYHIRETISFLSYIDFQFNYLTLASKSSVTPTPGYSKVTSLSDRTIYEKIDISKFIIYPVYDQSILLRISAPVYTFLNVFTAEVGFIGGINNLKYKLEYAYRYDKTVINRLHTGPSYHLYWTDMNQIEKSEKHYIYSPVIAIKYNPLNFLTTGIDLTLNYLSVLARYEF